MADDLLYVVAVERVLQIDDFMEVCNSFLVQFDAINFFHACLCSIRDDNLLV